jgi:hypothetical protein
VNFHAGDWLFYPRNAMSYRKPMAQWPAWLQAQVEHLRIDLIFLFGDCRPIHRAALQVAQRLGVEVGVFVDELVAGALLHYPIYWDWDLKGYTNCEAVLHRIVEQRSALEARGDLHTLRAGWLRRQWRKLDALARAWLQSP